MRILSSLRRRLTGEVIPPAPFKARDSVATRIFSIDDDPYQPSSSLLELAADAIRQASKTDLSSLSTRPNMPAALQVWPGEHYRLLAALVQLLRPRSVIEIGTFTGMGTLALREFLPAGARLTTFDIQAWNSLPHTCLLPEDFSDGRVVQHLDDLADSAMAVKHRELLAGAELIFIDGPHDGPTEYRILKHLRAAPFAHPPLLVFDDIKLPTMLKFWHDLACPKLDFTSFGHWSGTGLAQWQQ